MPIDFIFLNTWLRARNFLSGDSLRRQLVRGLARWIPLVFLCIIIVLCMGGINEMYVVAADMKGIGNLNPNYFAADIEKSLGDLKWLLTAIISAAGLFTIAQGAATHFTAQNFLKNIEKTEKDIEKTQNEMKDTQKNIEMQFPLFAEYEHLFERAQSQLSQLTWIDGNDHSRQSVYWKSLLYEKMPLTERQQIIILNRIVPYVFRKDVNLETYINRVRVLAMFYWGKFIYEKRRGYACLDDLEYAEYLIQQAMERKGQEFYLLNDMGNIQIEYYKALRSLSPPEETPQMEEARKRARRCLEESIQKEKRQLRAYYNLAYLEAELAISPINNSSNAIQDAIGRLRTSLNYTHWEDREIPELTCRVHYNLACYLSRSLRGGLECNQEVREQIISQLQNAAKVGSIPQNSVHADFDRENINADFYPLFQCPNPSSDPDWNRLEQELSQNSD